MQVGNNAVIEDYVAGIKSRFTGKIDKVTLEVKEKRPPSASHPLGNFAFEWKQRKGTLR